MNHLLLSIILIVVFSTSTIFAASIPSSNNTQSQDSNISIEALWAQSLKDATSPTAKVQKQYLQVGAFWKTPRKEIALKEVTPETISTLRLLSHANVPIKVLMVCTTTTRDEVQGMFEIIKIINEESNLPQEEKLILEIIAESPAALRGLNISQEDFKNYCKICPYFKTNDLWMQDWGEIAAVQLKNTAKEHLAIVDTGRGRELAALPSILAKQWNGYYVKPAVEHDKTGNYGGNIEVTPDNILVIGNTATEKLRSFFDENGYRDRMAVLKTDWLLVGHVDEYLSTLCTPDEQLGYTLIKADPRMAMAQLKSIPQNKLAERLNGMVKSFYKYYSMNSKSYEVENSRMYKMFDTIGYLYKYLNGINNKYSSLSKSFVAFNETCADTIDKNVDALKAKIRELNGDVNINVISFPTLFDIKRRGRACAFSPGVVNMVVLRDHLIIPDPLLKEYRDHISNETSKIGYKAHFVPNGTYHFSNGQLHCGSNTFRHPNRYIHSRYDRRERASKLHNSN